MRTWKIDVLLGQLHQIRSLPRPGPAHDQAVEAMDFVELLEVPFSRSEVRNSQDSDKKVDQEHDVELWIYFDARISMSKVCFVCLVVLVQKQFEVRMSRAHLHQDRELRRRVESSRTELSSDDLFLDQ